MSECAVVGAEEGLEIEPIRTNIFDNLYKYLDSWLVWTVEEVEVDKVRIQAAAVSHPTKVLLKCVRVSHPPWLLVKLKSKCVRGSLIWGYNLQIGPALYFW